MPIDQGKIYGRSLAFPVRVGPDGRMQWSEGAQNIRESIRIILLTHPNERLRLADFGGGLNDFLFQPNIPSRHRLIQDRIEKSLARWEPRISVESVQVDPDPQDAESVIITLSYRLIATQTRERVAFNLALRA
jgi:hypothetical protein